MRAEIKKLENGQIMTEIEGNGEELLEAVAALSAHVADLILRSEINRADAEELIKRAALHGVATAAEERRRA